MKNITRRQAIKLISASGLALYLDFSLNNKYSFAKTGSVNLANISPIDRTLEEKAKPIFFADEPERAHNILWDKLSFLKSIGGKIPSPEKSVEFAIVGGGMSGLLSAYILRKHKPFIIEQSARLGGNSKGQSWQGIDYSIGAAYLIEPEKDSDTYNLLNELGVTKEWRIKNSGDYVAIKNILKEGLWEGELDSKNIQIYKKLTDYFANLNEETNGYVYPDIPVVDPERRDNINKLDQISFIKHLEEIAGQKLPTLLETAIEQYCWSSFGASSSEISAASGLNFLAAEFSSVAVLPGGNSRVAEKAMEKLLEVTPTENVKVNSLVFHVEVVKDGVLISYYDFINQKAHTVKANKAIMACPKFVVNKVLHEIEPERSKAISRLKYRSYLVANVLIDQKIDKDFYDLYLLGDADSDFVNSREEANKQKVTDVVLANFASSVKDKTVLSLYRALPYDGSRIELYMPDAYQRIRKEFEEQITNSILPLLKLSPKNIVDLRIARWGHPLPVASVGLIAEGIPEILRKPFKDRVYFVEQDNWALPAFETACSEALYWTKIIARS
jgi:protoporphyrinogen oxidase